MAGLDFVGRRGCQHSLIGAFACQCGAGNSLRISGRDKNQRSDLGRGGEQMTASVLSTIVQHSAQATGASTIKNAASGRWIGDKANVDTKTLL